MTTDNFCFYLQNRLIHTSQIGGQWYSDTSPFSIPWRVILALDLRKSSTVWIWQHDKRTDENKILLNCARQLMKNKGEKQAWACIIKLITAVIYGFCNKLECLAHSSLISRSNICLHTSLTVLLGPVS
jgi:hypothetical protein